ncbi:hypothetical protein [Paremcibacter congregatus]|uniref:hypothetical protein n=1 Tax=Paremcibacter congregatus TaxID=2043170 RepID=UPI003A9419B0
MKRRHFSTLMITACLTLVTALPATAEGKKDSGALTEEIYLTIPPYAVTMYHKGLPKGSMTIRASLRVVDGKKRAQAQKYMPRLSNAYLIETNRLSHDYFDVTRPVSVAALGDTLQIATNRVLGHEDAKLLISDVSINKR